MRHFKTGGFPDRNTEYFLYQTLIGAWPIERDRMTAYMEKAVREAKAANQLDTAEQGIRRRI